MFSSVLRRPLFNRIIFSSIHTVRFSSSSKPLSFQLRGDQFLPYGSEQDNERILHLEAQVKEAREPRARSSYRLPVKSRERLGVDGTFQCSTCKVFNVGSAFYVDSKQKYGYSSMCKMCKREQQRQYCSRTLRGIMIKLLGSSRNVALKRSMMPLRKEAGQFDLTRDFLLNLWEKQLGRCAYSGMVMSLDPFTSWRLSLERLDNVLGYVPGNVAFICSEFNTPVHPSKVKNSAGNGSTQWSKKKVCSLPRELDLTVPLHFSDVQLATMLIAEKGRKSNQRRSKSQTSASGLLLCTCCGQCKSVDTDFHRDSKSSVGKQSWCKSCRSAWQSTYAKSFGGFIKTRLWAAQSHARARRNKGRVLAGEYSLTIDDMLRMYQQQNGLCFYSGLRLCLQSNSEWMCSIERLDNSKGYICDNVALICAEFQTSDFSYCAKVPVRGSAQWSREKVEMLVQWLRINEKP